MTTASLIPQQAIDAVREASDILELIGERTTLRKTGQHEHTGLCPLHQERTGSFSVNAEKRVFYCHGCQAKGDAIAFVRQAEGLDFTGAVEYLAIRYGVDLTGRSISRTWSTTPARRDPRPSPVPDSPAWRAWYALGGTVAEAKASNPLGDARSWIDHRRRHARHVGDLDLDAQLAGVLGLDGEPWSVWTAPAVDAALRDAYAYQDTDGILAVLKALNAIDRADATLALQACTTRCAVLLAELLDAGERAAA